MLVAIDYFTKWVEAEALVTIIEARTPTRETPFRLTYGTEAVILVDVGITSVMREMFHEESSLDQLRINLDCLDEVREKASNKMTKY